LRVITKKRLEVDERASAVWTWMSAAKSEREEASQMKRTFGA